MRGLERGLEQRERGEDVAWLWGQVCQAALTKQVRAWQELQAGKQRNWNGPDKE